MKKPVYIIDAMNYIFRAYYALPDNITSRDGMLTNAVLGYLRTLLRIINERKPEYMAAAF
jgi:DNA polymerase-1